MINTEEEKSKKKKENDDKYDISDELIQKNLIQLLETQVTESEEKILEKKITVEREITLLLNRLSKDIENSRKFSLEKLIIEFLPIFDNIDRAVNLIEKTEPKKVFKDILKKLTYTSNLLKEIFVLFNLEKIEDINIPFNPSIHQAMSIHYTNDIESNQIITVMQPGYLLFKSRLLRPAMVVVSKKTS